MMTEVGCEGRKNLNPREDYEMLFDKYISELIYSNIATDYSN